MICAGDRGAVGVAGVFEQDREFVAAEPRDAFGAGHRALRGAR